METLQRESGLKLMTNSSYGNMLYNISIGNWREALDILNTDILSQAPEVAMRILSNISQFMFKELVQERDKVASSLEFLKQGEGVTGLSGDRYYTTILFGVYCFLVECWYDKHMK